MSRVFYLSLHEGRDEGCVVDQYLKISRFTRQDYRVNLTVVELLFGRNDY